MISDSNGLESWSVKLTQDGTPESIPGACTKLMNVCWVRDRTLAKMSIRPVDATMSQ